MKISKIKGIYREGKKIFTENPKPCKGIKVYNEKLVKYKNKELRSWNPYRSKFAAAILKGLSVKLLPNSNVLYLGASTGTTVSHISDILKEGTIYAIENSPFSLKALLSICSKRSNIIPFLGDANHPDRYSSITPQVDFIYQDISQRNQAEIFFKNIERYLKVKGSGILMIKARSIDISLKPKKAYEQVCNELEKNGLKINELIELSPYEKDHAALSISN